MNLVAFKLFNPRFEKLSSCVGKSFDNSQERLPANHPSLSLLYIGTSLKYSSLLNVSSDYKVPLVNCSEYLYHEHRCQCQQLEAGSLHRRGSPAVPAPGPAPLRGRFGSYRYFLRPSEFGIHRTGIPMASQPEDVYCTVRCSVRY